MLRVLFMGRKPVAARCLEALSGLPGLSIVGVLTDNHLAVSPTAEMAERLGVPVYDFADATRLIDQGQLQFDLGLSMLYWRRIKGAMLATPSLGVINFHPAPLPQYKGTAGYNLAILEGLDRWAVSAHYMDEAIDTGDIIELRELPVDVERETAQSLERKSAAALEELFSDVVAKAIKGQRLTTSPNIGGRYVSRQEMEEMKLIQPGDDIERKTRAFWFPPYDGAYIVIDGQKYTLIGRQILSSLADANTSSLFTKSAED